MGYDFEVLSGKILEGERQKIISPLPRGERGEQLLPLAEAAIAVHKALGPGFMESVSQKAMEVALRHRSISFEQQKEIHIVSRMRKWVYTVIEKTFTHERTTNENTNQSARHNRKEFHVAPVFLLVFSFVVLS